MAEQCPKCGKEVCALCGGWCDCAIADLKAEDERLRAIVDKLPKTRDGVPVLPGTRVYFHSAGPDSATKGCLVSELDIWEKGKGPSDFNGTAWTYEIEGDDEGPVALPDDFGLYSTPEALEAAKEKKE